MTTTTLMLILLVCAASTLLLWGAFKLKRMYSVYIAISGLFLAMGYLLPSDDSLTVSGSTLTEQISLFLFMVFIAIVPVIHKAYVSRVNNITLITWMFSCIILAALFGQNVYVKLTQNTSFNPQKLNDYFFIAFVVVLVQTIIIMRNEISKHFDKRA